MKNLLLTSLFLGILSFSHWSCSPKSSTPGMSREELLSGFQNPPNEARPRVWWHWMNGNITKEGIQKDLDWMERTGIGGFHNFDANLFTPLVTEKKLVFMTPEWKEAFRFTTDLAIEKGMEMTIAGSPGWSETGGPWVEPKDGMKKYVWTETIVQGGKTYSGKLPQPADNIGHFQNITTEEGGVLGGFVGEQPKYYQDAQVFAYRMSDGEKTLKDLNPKVSSSGGDFNLKKLTDGDLHHSEYLPPVEVGKNAWIQYEFTTPHTFKAFSVTGITTVPLAEFNGNPENRALQVSDDGVNYRDITKVPGSIVPQVTISIEPATAKYWRMNWETLPPAFNPFLAMAGLPVGEPKPEGVNVAEFVLYTTDRINQFEDKAGFSPWQEDSPTYLPKEVIAIEQDKIIDLTEKMQADGSLNWDIPEGHWVIVRFGYSLTGRQNHPASPEATGLEVDKLDEEAVRRYINHYLDLYEDATGGKIGEKGLGSIILDSYEAGHMTWTHDFPEEFQKRKGYDIRPWLPVLTGRVVESVEKSEKFLWDFRNTIGEMIVENHYDIIGEELNKRGMGRYTESHENKRIFLADGMDVKRNAEVPMSAMWTPGSLAGGTDEEVRSEADIREAASVANIYNKAFVAAESMTSVGKPFQEHPARLKRTADLELASGLNRFVIHTSVHQPLDDKMPGFSLGPFGQYFGRQETWAKQARPWIDYLSRSSYLLQQGKNIADILYYYGENTNITWISRESLPPIPAGYEFDYVNATALLEAIEMKNGQLTAKSGNTYQLIVLDESAKQMTLPILKKLNALVQAGAKLTGTKPERTPSLSDDANEFQRILNQLWNSPNVWKGSIESALQSLHISKDVDVKNTSHKILFRHRQTADIDLFWLNNRSENTSSIDVSFRITGKVPQLWQPQTGETKAVSYKIENNRTIIPLEFESWDAFFIIFAEKATQNELFIPTKEQVEFLTITGPWSVKFQKGRGAPEQATFETLQSWSDHENKGIKYFSGTAIYSNTFDIVEISENAQYELDLGEVKNIAEVIVNEQSLGILWKTPYSIDLKNTLKKGQNTLEIQVTNSWVNRLIGDAQPDVKEKITFTTMPFYQADGQLQPSGLLGEIQIVERR
ncbi:MAG: glycosyl hydrolase [Bacteroidia bacterium]|nr:glycosyl hydrolase [Bacteroidia bacterium]